MNKFRKFALTTTAFAVISILIFFIALMSTSKEYKVSFIDTDYLIMENGGYSENDYFWSETPENYQSSASYEILDELHLSIDVEFILRPFTRKVLVKEIETSFYKKAIFIDEHTHVEYEPDDIISAPQKNEKIKMSEGFYFEPRTVVTFDGVKIENDKISKPSLRTGPFSYEYSEKYDRDELYCNGESIAEEKYWNDYWYVFLDDNK